MLTTFSGLVHLFVSNSTWDIDPRNRSTYQWSAVELPYQLDIAQRDLRQGPYWIYVHALQNSTYSLLATEFYFTGVQMGLRRRPWSRATESSHVFALTVPGGGYPRSHDVFVTLVPLMGRAWLYGTNITGGFRYPNHSVNGSIDYRADYLYSKAQTMSLQSSRCFNERCTYLVEVFCPVDTVYTINAYPWNAALVNYPTTVIEQHVPQYAFLDAGGDDPSRGPIGRFEFHIPENNSTAVLTFTPQWTSRWDTTVGWQNQDVLVIVDRFDFATETDGPGVCWRTSLAMSPSIIIDADDECFRRPNGLNRTQSGVYYVTVFNLGRELVEYTMSLFIWDRLYADNRGVILVDTIAQNGVNGPTGGDPMRGPPRHAGSRPSTACTTG